MALHSVLKGCVISTLLIVFVLGKISSIGYYVWIIGGQVLVTNLKV